MPYGCFFNSHGNFLNQFQNNQINCGTNVATQYSLLGSMNDTTTSVGLVMNITNNSTHFIIWGPSDVWFGVGFGATAMKDQPYTIVVEGTGNVFEQQLGNHEPGVRLNSSISILSKTVTNGVRYVSFIKSNSNYYNFTNTITDINTIKVAQGSTSF